MAAQCRSALEGCAHELTLRAVRPHVHHLRGPRSNPDACAHLRSEWSLAPPWYMRLLVSQLLAHTWTPVAANSWNLVSGPVLQACQLSQQTQDPPNPCGTLPVDDNWLFVALRTSPDQYERPLHPMT